MGENTVAISTEEYSKLIKAETLFDAFINALITGAGYSKYSQDLHHDDELVNTFLMAIDPARYEEKVAELAEVQDE